MEYKKVKKLVYIASMEHSGSTLLSLILSGHKKVASFGEVVKIIKEGKSNLSNLKNRTCMCQEKVSNCIYWKEVLEDGRFIGASDIAASYRAILDAFAATFGEDTFFVDSSKILEPLAALKEIENLEIKVIFIIKDVRAFIVSQRSNVKRKSEPGTKLPSIMSTAKHWYKQNGAIIKYLKQNGLDFFSVSYEELCLYPDKIVPKLFDYLGLEYEDSLLQLKPMQEHHIFGNRMRKQPEKNKAILYDNRWFGELNSSIFLKMMPSIWKFNLEKVYSNSVDNFWSK